MSGFNMPHLIRQVDLFTIKLFLAAAEERQIGRAAARENIAPSAATKRIQDLEQIAGVRLFDRNPKGVELSAAGKVLARHFAAILGSLEALRSEMGAFSEGVQGHVRIASTASIVIQFLARELGEFARNFPLVQMDLRDDSNPNVVRAVLSGDADVGVFVASEDLALSGLDCVEYRSDRLVAVAPRGHPLSGQETVSLDALCNADLISIGTGTSLMAAARAAAKKRGQEFQPKFRVHSAEAARSLVHAGLGVAVQPECMLSIEDHERLAILAIDEPWARRSLQIGTQGGRPQTAAAKALVKLLLDRPTP
ncbi:LysR family transcriptional regulator [Alicycliphilus denitrificans]|uniref:LysR family transcriptional regulator n=1 Tax=Alicycliphilus denitrificans TaxID=179636 RepID=A0A3R7IJ32_9BURK|nr:LysR family transcriptional regulator [Alicycliphilus denitrificans]RKJ99636.1 LysR family transcriptional regulator [Alicycliphilus denitrificans]